MLEAITRTLVREFDTMVDTGLRSVQRRVLRLMLRLLFAAGGIAALTLGIILLGSHYVGLDLMLMLTGIVFLFVFFLFL